MTQRRPSDTHQPSHHPSARKQKQKKNCSAAVFTLPGFWLTPDGTILQVSSSHVAYVIDHPETFGFTRDELIAIYGQHHERLKVEGKAREVIIRNLVSRGFIRIRRYHDRWSVTISDLSQPVIQTLTRFARSITGEGIHGTMETDQETPVKIVSLQIDAVIPEISMSDLSFGTLLKFLPDPGAISTHTSGQPIPSEVQKPISAGTQQRFDHLNSRLIKKRPRYQMCEECKAIYRTGEPHRCPPKWKVKGIGLHQTEEITATSAVNAACQYLSNYDHEQKPPDRSEIVIVEDEQGHYVTVSVTRMVVFQYSAHEL